MNAQLKTEIRFRIFRNSRSVICHLGLKKITPAFLDPDLLFPDDNDYVTEFWYKFKRFKVEQRIEKENFMSNVCFALLISMGSPKNEPLTTHFYRLTKHASFGQKLQSYTICLSSILSQLFDFINCSIRNSVIWLLVVV